MNKFTKENVLICWNDNDFSQQLIKKGYKVATSYNELKGFKYVTSEELNLKPDKRRKNEPIEIKIKAIVVLCELTWGLSFKNKPSLSPLHVMSGIEFVMELRRENFLLPVVFVSFLNRQQQLNLSSRNEIISTPILGHHYCLLPSEPDEWFAILNQAENEEISQIELDDIKRHFCDQEGMLKELKHDLLKYLDETQVLSKRDEKFRYVYKKIRDIIGIDENQKIEKTAKLSHVEDNQYKEKIKATSELIDQLILKIGKKKAPAILPDQKIKVVFLDDEIDVSPRLKGLITMMTENGFDVIAKSNTKAALDVIEKDYDNKIDLIISDYRIWNQAVTPVLMDQPQGYTFLKDCASFGRTYTYIVFSALDRNFLMTHFGLKTKTLYKNGVLANEASMLNFIQNLIDWGEENRENVISLNNYKAVFIKCYNWYKEGGRTDEIDSGVKELIQPILSEFNRVKNDLPNSCISRDGFSCEGCKLNKLLGNWNGNRKFIRTLLKLKSEYKLPEDWNSDNEDHVQNLIIKFAARLLYYTYYYTFIKFNCKLADDIAENLVEHGKIRFLFDKNPDNPKDKITGLLDSARYIWIKKTKISPTKEEQLFLKTLGI